MGSSAGELYKPLGAFLDRSRANRIASGRGDYFFPCYERNPALGARVLRGGPYAANPPFSTWALVLREGEFPGGVPFGTKKVMLENVIFEGFKQP